MKHFLSILLSIALSSITFDMKSQVWFPESDYNFVQPSVFSLDNQQIYTIGKAHEDTTKSYWVVSQYDGKRWIKLPLLTLNKNAEVLQIKAYAGSLYVAGNFTFDNGIYAAIIRFKDLSWQPIAKFKRNNQLAATISALEIFDNKLILGGNFNLIGSDTLPYLAAFNGISFSNILTKIPNCKRCYPNYFITDLSANDSVLAISGYFNQIGDKTSKSLFLLKSSGLTDTFASTPNNIVFDKIALNGTVISCTGINPLDKKINLYNAEAGSFTNLKYNFDTIIHVNEMAVYENNLWLNGIARLSGKTNKSITHQLINTTWIDFTSNYPGAKSIDVGRGSLWAIGNSEKPLSIWNTNKHIVRLYKSTALVKVKVFLDSNNNCIQEKNERILSKQIIKLSLPTINKYSVTNEQGLAEFLFPIPTLNSIKVPFNIALQRNFKTSNCAFDTIFKNFLNGVKMLDSIQFPVTRKTNINDIKVIISAPKGTQVMKDKRMEYLIFLENVGSNIVSGTMTLRKNSWLTSEKTDGKLDTSKVLWSYANLNPGEKRYFSYSGVANDARFVDNTLLQAQASATIASVKNDYLEDDIDSIEQIIDNSNNPFRKDIYPIPNPGDSISYLTLSNREIRYNISFNNFSSDTIYNAVITDTLDLNLDMSYIQETGSNKAYYTEIQTDPNNSYRGIIIWHFQNINLAPNPLKNFELPNTGSYIGFKVVMKPLSNGYIVKNTAAVFYDNYFKGKTNTAYCTIVNTSIQSVNKNLSNLLIYPNPANDEIHFDLNLNLNDKIVILNQQGQEVQSLLITENNTFCNLKIDTLNSGLYIAKVIKGNQIYCSKFVKM